MHVCGDIYQYKEANYYNCTQKSCIHNIPSNLNYITQSGVKTRERYSISAR